MQTQGNIDRIGTSSGLDSVLQGIASRGLAILAAMMKTGDPSHNIPVLDPLTSIPVLKNYTVDDLTFSFSRLRLTGLSNLQVGGQIILDTDQMVGTLPLSTKHVVLSGDYSLNGTVEKILPAKGSGPFQLSAGKLDITLRAGITWPDQQPPNITIQELRVAVAGPSIHFSNLDGDLSTIINQVLNAYAPNLVNEFEPVVIGFFQPLLQGLINELIRSQNISAPIQASNFGGASNDS